MKSQGPQGLVIGNSENLIVGIKFDNFEGILVERKKKKTNLFSIS